MLYQTVASELRQRIESGIYEPGSRLPGARRLASDFDVSVTTAMAALHGLEDAGLINGKNRSGFFVAALPADAPARTPPEPMSPCPVSNQAITLDLLRACARLPMGRMGLAIPDRSFLPVLALERSFRLRSSWDAGDSMGYTFPPGMEALRSEIAKRLLRAGCTVAPSQIMITNGGQESLFLSLQSCTQPGDVVAVESPIYYGLLQVIERLGLKALEIPSDPRLGLSLSALELAIEQWPVRACVVTPNFSNPTGSVLSDASKAALAKLLQGNGIALIEDDIFGELSFEEERPRALYGYADPSRSYLCGSASKTISAGLRVGWLAIPEDRREELEFAQFTQHAGVATIPQLALSEYFRSGRHDRHLRRIRPLYRELLDRTANALQAALPTSFEVTCPRGGYLLWVCGPPEFDGMALYQQARHEGISIAPGPLFSTRAQFQSCFRLNAAIPWGAETEAAIATLGALSLRQLDERRGT